MAKTKHFNRSKRKLVGQVHKLSRGTTRKFTLRCEGTAIEAVLLNFGGSFFAYVNRCPHISLPLDWVDNQFFDVKKRYILCANHGATYEPATGECIWGPCFGECLQAVPLEIENGKIFASCPESM